MINHIAIPGTIEPIMIWLDDQNTLWFYTAADGLFKREGSEFLKIADPMMGVGQTIWSPVMNNWISIEYAGSNLVTYDYTLKERVDLTSYLNAFDLVSGSSGDVFFPRYEFIYLVSGGELKEYAGPLDNICAGIEIDHKGRLYAALSDGRIYRISSAGDAFFWEECAGACAALAFDGVTNSIITCNRSGGEM